MGQGPAKSLSSVAEPPISERLESWKEIAVYLKRGVRTVQRWEREEGLPVHRHMHDKLGTVYAYRSQIDAWWANGRTRLEAEVEPVASSERRWLSWRLLAVAVVIVAGVGIGWQRTRPQAPALPFAARDWVLIVAFENRTGEPAFDGVLEHALERELSNSRFVNVAPRERIHDALQLMRKPLDSRVDAGVGREICLRDDGIRALITGRVEKLDTTYLLSASLINPASGATVASLNEEAAGQKEVVPALGRLSRRVRRSLGEELSAIRQSEQKLEKVTTPSLPALQFYSQGMALVNEHKWESAAQFLKRAVEEDPQFASAHILLAHCYSNLQKDAEAAPHYERAYALAQSTTDRERYFILGSYYQRFLNDKEKAAQAYEVLVQLYPDHYWGTNNLVLVLEELGRLADAVVYIRQRAALRPNDVRANCSAAVGVARMTGNRTEAGFYLLRAQQLAGRALVEKHPVCAALIEILPTYDHWLRGDAEKFRAEADRLRRSLPSRNEGERATLGLFVGGLYADLGRLRQAEELLQSEPDPAIRHWNLAYIAQDRGDWQGYRAHVREMSRYPEKAWWLDVPILYARVGLLREARKAIERLEQGKAEGLDIARGELALALGQKGEALRLFKKGFESVRSLNRGEFGNGADSLARALEQEGDLEGAQKVLEEAARIKTMVGTMTDGSSWIRVQHQRARLYRMLKRDRDAQKIEEELLKLLAYADEDHAILRELRRQQETATSAAAKQ